MNNMQEDIRRIADSLGFKELEGFDIPLYKFPNGNNGYFNPYSNSADAFMVLEAFVKKQGGMLVEIWSNGDNDEYMIQDDDSTENPWFGKGHLNEGEEDLKHAICTAYLSLIGDKEESVACDKRCFEVFHMTGGNHRTDCAVHLKALENTE